VAFCEKLDFFEITRVPARGTEDIYIKFNHREADIDTYLENKLSKAPGIYEHTKISYFDNDQKKIVLAFSDCFSITRSLKEDVSYMRYVGCLMRPNELFEEKFGLDKEMILIFSKYDTFDTRALQALEGMHNELATKFGQRVDSICSVIVSNDENIVKEIKKHLTESKQDMRAIVPFSYSELLENSKDMYDFDSDGENESFVEKWRGFIASRFSDILGEIDLFAFARPIENEKFFFGRKQFVQSLVQRHLSNENSGVFGLRRSGKTSVLYAMQRILDNSGKKWFFIDAGTLVNMRWNQALRHIVSVAYKKNEVEFTPALDEYESAETAALAFARDMEELCGKTGGDSLLFMLDEVEHITFGIADTDHWLDEEDYISFWNAIKSYSHNSRGTFNYVISGTDPRAIEVARIGARDNPLFLQVAIKDKYIPPFDESETEEMVNRLGVYMALSFDKEVCFKLTRDYGGQPFVMRLICSKIKEYVTNENLARPIVINRTIYDSVKGRFDRSLELVEYFNLILAVLAERYVEEYELLKDIALGNVTTLDQLGNHAARSHLEGYGLIDVVGNLIGIKHEEFRNYLRDQNKYDRIMSIPEEMHDQTMIRLRDMELKLQLSIRDKLRHKLGLEAARQILLDAFRHRNTTSAGDVRRGYYDLTLKEIYSVSCKRNLVDYFDVVLYNWDHFSDEFPNRNAFSEAAKRLTYFRNRIAHHPNPNLVTPSEYGEFRRHMKQMEEWLSVFDY
jgi:hypothetical protein